MTIERSGTRSRPLRRMERRSEQQGRDMGDRIDGLNPSDGTTFIGGVLLEGIQITTTPQAFPHGLRAADGSVGAAARFAPRAFRGAWIIKGNTGAFQLLVSSIGDDSKVVGLACDTGGPHVVSVAVV